MTKIFPSEQFCTQNVFSFNLVVTENALVINLSVAGTQPVIYSVPRIQTKLNCTKANIRLLVLCKRKKNYTLRCKGKGEKDLHLCTLQFGCAGEWRAELKIHNLH